MAKTSQGALRVKVDAAFDEVFGSKLEPLKSSNEIVTDVSSGPDTLTLSTMNSGPPPTVRAPATVAHRLSPPTIQNAAEITDLTMADLLVVPACESGDAHQNCLPVVTAPRTPKRGLKGSVGPII